MGIQFSSIALADKFINPDFRVSHLKIIRHTLLDFKSGNFIRVFGCPLLIGFYGFFNFIHPFLTFFRLGS